MAWQLYPGQNQLVAAFAIGVWLLTAHMRTSVQSARGSLHPAATGVMSVFILLSLWPRHAAIAPDEGARLRSG